MVEETKYKFLDDKLRQKLDGSKEGEFPVFIVMKQYDDDLVEYLQKSGGKPYRPNHDKQTKEIIANVNKTKIEILESDFKNNITTIVLDEEPENNTPDAFSIVESTEEYLKKASNDENFSFQIDPGANRKEVVNYLKENDIKPFGGRNVYITATMSKEKIYDLSSKIDVSLIRFER